MAALAGLLMAMLLLFLSLIAGQLVTKAAGHEAVPEDAGDVFDKAAQTVAFADRALQAATRGEAVPRPPTLLADVVAARVFFALAGLSTLLLVIPVAAATRRRPRALVRLAGLDRFRTAWLWQPALWMMLAYVGVIAYSEVARTTGVDILIPDQPVPRAALRDPLTMTLFGLLAILAAPIGEEALFRGLVFGGLSRWGFWPAALISGFAFALSHVDPGTFMPFTAIGVLFASLFWRSGSLWPSMVCHAGFNGTSFLLLILTS